jgi:micrococcal nuclease
MRDTTCSGRAGHRPADRCRRARRRRRPGGDRRRPGDPLGRGRHRSDHPGTVRLIGIDTPERGRCGYAAATRHARALAPAGSLVRLGNPPSVNDRDRYGRNLRFLLTPAGRDLGLAQIRAGAWAAFDGRDGYQRHPRQTAYRRADARTANYRCGATPTPGGGVAPIGNGDCPPSAPLKGNRESMIYHAPGQQYYAITHAEICFATPADAEAAGYRAARI